jgi:class 3 adenylate cyclase
MGIFSRFRLRTKIFISLFGMMALLVTGSLFLVNRQADKAVQTGMRLDLERSAAYLSASYTASLKDLESRLNAVIYAAPYLKPFLTDIRDAATILQWLKVQANETLSVPYLMLIDAEGTVLARTHAPELHGDLLPSDSPLRALLAGERALRVLDQADGRYFDVIALPVLDNGYPIGIIAAGQELTPAMALEFRDQTDCEIMLATKDKVLVSTLIASKTQALQAQENAAPLMLGVVTAPLPMVLEREAYQAVSGDLVLPTAGGDSLHYALLRSVDAAMAPYVNIQRNLAYAGLVMLALALLASLYVAQDITKPLSLLVMGAHAVKNGDYRVELSVSSRDEVGTLAEAFNEMVRGLREKLEIQKFVSNSTRDMIRRGDAERKTERKRVTMLFSDIRGFSSISEKLPPEDVISFVNQALAMQTDSVKKFGGDIDKFVGDELIAVFQGDDMVLRAIRCAIEIQKKNLGDAVVDGQRRAIRVGIGVNAGDIVVGSVGNQERQDYTILGSPVNLSARLCSAALEGEILIAEDAYREVSDLVGAEKLEPIRVKGFEHAVPVYRIRVEGRA